MLRRPLGDQSPPVEVVEHVRFVGGQVAEPEHSVWFVCGDDASPWPVVRPVGVDDCCADRDATCHCPGLLGFCSSGVACGDEVGVVPLLHVALLSSCGGMAMPGHLRGAGL